MYPPVLEDGVPPQPQAPGWSFLLHPGCVPVCSGGRAGEVVGVVHPLYIMLPTGPVKQAWAKSQMPRILPWDLGLRQAPASIFPQPLGFPVLARESGPNSQSCYGVTLLLWRTRGPDGLPELCSIGLASCLYSGPHVPTPPRSDPLAPSVPALGRPAPPKGCAWEETLHSDLCLRVGGLEDHTRLWGTPMGQKEEGPGSIVKRSILSLWRDRHRWGSGSQPSGFQNPVESGDSCGCASPFTHCGYSFGYWQSLRSQALGYWDPQCHSLPHIGALTPWSQPAESALYLGTSSRSCVGQPAQALLCGHSRLLTWRPWPSSARPEPPAASTRFHTQPRFPPDN